MFSSSLVPVNLKSIETNDASFVFSETSKLSSLDLVAWQLSHQSAFGKCVSSCFLLSSSVGSSGLFSPFGSLENSTSSPFEISTSSFILFADTACFSLCHTWALLPVFPIFKNSHAVLSFFSVLSGVNSTPATTIASSILSPKLGSFSSIIFHSPSSSFGGSLGNNSSIACLLSSSISPTVFFFSADPALGSSLGFISTSSSLSCSFLFFFTGRS